MTNALRPAPPKAADGASAGVITPRKFSRRKILGATVDGQFGAYILSRRSVNLGAGREVDAVRPNYSRGGSMKTQEQLDAEYQQWLGMVAAAVKIRNRIIASGGMANKTRVEDEIMPMFGIDRYDAHIIMNHIEHHNLR